LLAPVRMLAHSRFVVEALLGLRLSWGGQHRRGPIRWTTAFAMHGGGALLGIGWTVFAWWLRPLYFFWSLPVTLPLALAPIVAVVTSHTAGGKARSWRRGLLQTPNTTDPPQVVTEWELHLAAATRPGRE